MNYLYPITAIHIDGATSVLYSIEAVRAHVRKHGVFEERHVVYWYDYRNHCQRERLNTWILRDDRGRIVKYNDVIPPITYDYRWTNVRNAKIRAIAAKGLPIPGTGCSKAGWKFNHKKKKHGGLHTRQKAAERARYDASIDGAPLTHRDYFVHDPWWE